MLSKGTKFFDTHKSFPFTFLTEPATTTIYWTLSIRKQSTYVARKNRNPQKKGAEFKVVASKYRWVIFIGTSRIRYAYSVGFEPAWGATELMKMIIEQWDELLVEEDVK